MLYIHGQKWLIGEKFPSLDLSDSVVRFTADGDELSILLKAIKDASQKEPVILSFDDKQKIKAIKIVKLFTQWGLREAKEYVESNLPIELPQDGSIYSLEDAFIASLRSAGAIVRDRHGRT